MIVRCANCQTEFSLEDQQIGPEGATVRCSMCSYVFPVDPPASAGDQPWQIRTVEDLLFTAPDLTALREWIAEGRLHPDDQVSRTGRHWLRLGDMPEFSTVFSGFEDLPPVFETLGYDEDDDDDEGIPVKPVSAIEELGPPPSFGGTMPVIQGVDTDILVVDSPAHQFVHEDEVTKVARSEPIDLGLPTRIPGESSKPSPNPFPLAELGIHDDDDDDTFVASPPEPDAEPVRARPRPHSATAKVDAIPDVVEDAPVEQLRHRTPQPTVRYGADEVHGPSSMLDAVTHSVDEQEAKARKEAESAEVRTTAVAVERDPVRPREPSRKRPAAVAPPDSRSSDEVEVAPRKRKRRRADSYDDLDELPRKRSAWPLVAGLGLLAGGAVVFGVPSIRAKVMEAAGSLVGNEPFDPASLDELGQADAAMATLDPEALGKAEAALQGRLDGGEVPPAGVAAMKLAQVELLATRSIERAIGGVLGSEAAASAPDDVERATRILGSVVVEDVLDRGQMRRVRARLRLAQGRPDAEILPLLPEDGSGELRQLVVAAPLWRDAKAPVPAGAIAGLEGLDDRGALAELTLALAYLRAGDETRALKVAQALLEEVPGQPTALALQAQAGKAMGLGEVETEGGSDGGGTGEGGTEAGPTLEDEPDPAPEPKKATPKVESVDSLVERGCDMVESGDAGEGLELLRKATARRPTDLDAQLCTGQAHAKQGRTAEALATFEKILSRSPNFAPAVRNAAKAADKLGQTDKAVGYYRTLLGLRPRDPTALAYVEKHGS